MPIKYNQDDEKWMVDKHIPVAVLIVIIVQTVGVIVWAVNFQATTVTRLAALEKQVDALGAVNERLGRLEAITGTNSDILREIRGYIISRAKA